MIHIIASLKSNDNIVGFRFIQYETQKTMDVPIANVIGALKNGNSLVGIYISSTGQLKGSNGSLNRYPSIHLDKNQIEDSSTIIILKRLLDRNKEQLGYCICDYKGIVKNVYNNDLIRYLQNNKIANGKMIEIEGNNGYISAINGTYEIEELRERKEDIQTDREKEKTAEEKAKDQAEAYQDNSEEILSIARDNPKAYNYDNYELDEFLDFMAANNRKVVKDNWHMELDENNIYVDKTSNELMLKLPKTHLNIHLKITIDKISRLDKLIVCENGDNLRITSNLQEIGKLVIYGNSSIVDLGNIEIQQIIRNVEFTYPERIRVISNMMIFLGNGSDIDLSRLTNLKEIKSCFNVSKNINKIILPPRVELIKYSFNNLVVMKDNHLKVGAVKITESFKSIHMNVKNTLEILDGTKIINSSFGEPTSVILPDSIEELNNTFRLNICNKIPKELRIYKPRQTDKTTNIQELVDGYKIKEINRMTLRDQSLVISKNTRVYEMEHVQLKTLTFENKHVYERMYGRYIVCNELNLPLNIDKINGDISISIDGLFDFRKYPNITKIALDTFRGIKAKIIIIGDNVEYLTGIHHFEQDVSIYIGTGIKNEFSNTCISKKCTYYIIDKHPFEKQLKRIGARIINVKSPEEMLERIGYRDIKTAEKKSNKALVFVNDPNFKEIISSEKYKKYADILIRIRAGIENDNIFYSHTPRISKEKVAEDWLDKAYKDIDENISLRDYVNINNIEILDKDVFLNIMCLLAQTHNREIELLAYNLEDLEIGIRLADINIIRHDSTNYIIAKSYSFKCSSTYLICYMIVTNGKPINILWHESNSIKKDNFMSISNEYKINGSLAYINQMNLIKHTCFDKSINKINITKFLKTGDNFEYDSIKKLSSTEMPAKMQKEVDKVLKASLVALGELKKSILVCFDICNCRLIEFLKLDIAVSNRAPQIEYTVTEIVDFKDAIASNKYKKILNVDSKPSNKIRYIEQEIARVTQNKQIPRKQRKLTGKYYEFIRNSNKKSSITDVIFELIHMSNIFRPTKIREFSTYEVTQNANIKVSNKNISKGNIEYLFSIENKAKEIETYRVAWIRMDDLEKALLKVMRREFIQLNGSSSKAIVIQNMRIDKMNLCIALEEYGNIILYSREYEDKWYLYKELFRFESLENIVDFLNLYAGIGLTDTIDFAEVNLKNLLFNIVILGETDGNALFELKKDVENGIEKVYTNDNFNLIRQLVK